MLQVHTGDALNAWLEFSHASRMADCVCLDHQLRRTSCNHFQHYYRPRYIQLRDLSAKGVAYDSDHVGTDFGPLCVNLWFRQLLNTFELLGGLLHIIFFIASIITLVVLAQRSTPDFVFNTLTTGQSGWTNPGVSWGLGLLTVTFAVSGAEWHPRSYFQVIDKV